MTIADIKKKLGILQFGVTPDMDMEGKATGWYSEFNGADRVLYSFTPEAMAKIQEDIDCPDLTVITSQRMSKTKEVLNEDTGEVETKAGEAYVKHMIILREGVLSF